MRLHIVGSSAAVPRPNRANSCYLLESEGTAIVLDCGSGAFARLRAATDVAGLAATFISHMHADHFIDLIAMRYALKYEFKRSSLLPVFLHKGARAELDRVVTPFAKGEAFFRDVMEFHTYDETAAVEVENFTLRFARTQHYIEAYAMRVESGATAITYSADTAPDANVVTLARGADIFLCESALGAEGREEEPRGHSNAREAGEMAASAGAKHLVLTHYDAQADPEKMLAAARTSFGGSISIADDGLVLSS